MKRVATGVGIIVLLWFTYTVGIYRGFSFGYSYSTSLHSLDRSGDYTKALYYLRDGHVDDAVKVLEGRLDLAMSMFAAYGVLPKYSISAREINLEILSWVTPYHKRYLEVEKNGSGRLEYYENAWRQVNELRESRGIKEWPSTDEGDEEGLLR